MLAKQSLPSFFYTVFFCLFIEQNTLFSMFVHITLPTTGLDELLSDWIKIFPMRIERQQSRRPFSIASPTKETPNV